MPGRVVIREAGAEDVGAIVELWVEMIDFHAERDPFFARSADGDKVFAEFVAKNIAGETVCVLVAERDGRIVGYCQGMIERHPPVLERVEYGQILDFGVTADCRRTGVGEQLCTRLCEWLAAKGVHRIEVRHSIANEIASRFWPKMGFRPYLKTLCMEV